MKSEQANPWMEEKRLNDYLKHHFGLHVKKVKPIRRILRIKTDMGTYALKRVHPREKERWKMVTELATHLGSRFPISAPIATRTGQLIFAGFHHKYVLLPWINAEPVSLQNKTEWVRLTRKLARFHHYSQTFTPAHAYRKLQRIGKWQAEWKHAYRQLELFQLAAKWTRKPTETDQSWLEVAGYSTGVMENLLRYFEKIKGDQCCLESAKQGKVCHGNLHPHNVLADEQKQFYLIDWNQAVFDVRTRDLAQWLLYAFHRTRSGEILTILLRSYQQISPLSEEEYALIYARFLYPERLMRVLRNIYEDQTLPITAGAPSIVSASKAEEQKLGLMKVYPRLVQEAFGVKIPQIEWLSK